MRYILLALTLVLMCQAHATSQPALQQQLLNMAKQSQTVRNNLATYKQGEAPEALLILATDINNLHSQTLNEIVTLHGWPNKNLVGIEGVQATVIIVQNSEQLAFQQNMLPYIIQSFLDAEGVSGQNVAQITDQVALKQSKAQVFGSQYDVINNKVVFKPIENEEAVDNLRAELKLAPLSQFKQALERALIHEQ